MSLPRLTVLLFLLVSFFNAFAGPEKNVAACVNDLVSNSAEQNIKDTVVIRFDYKQSALYHTYTFEALDSVIAILLKNKDVTLSIDGYAYKDEGSDTICYYLSLNRALFIQTYVLGRGVDKSRILAVTGFGRTKPLYKGTDKEGLTVNCRAEIKMNYPAPVAVKPELQDKDKDGIADIEDNCPDVFGYKENKGCPNKDVVIVPFETELASLYSLTYKVLDSVISILSENPSLTISIGGHAYKDEGINALCERLANERAAIVKNYLLSRRIPVTRIDSVKGYGNTQPLNAGDTPLDKAKNSRAEIIFSSH